MKYIRRAYIWCKFALILHRANVRNRRNGINVKYKNLKTEWLDKDDPST